MISDVPHETILGSFFFYAETTNLAVSSIVSLEYRLVTKAILMPATDIDEINERVNFYLNKVRYWLAANTLTLNKTKKEFLFSLVVFSL